MSVCAVLLCGQEEPNHHQPVVRRTEAQSERTRASRVHVFARFGADLHAQPVFGNKITASELRRKSVKSALLVGKEQAVLWAASPANTAITDLVLC